MATEALRVLEAAAFTVVITKASLLAFLRTRGPALSRELFSCALCFGCWSGAAFYFGAPLLPRVAEAVGFISCASVLAVLLRVAIYQLERPWKPPP